MCILLGIGASIAGKDREIRQRRRGIVPKPLPASACLLIQESDVHRE